MIGRGRPVGTAPDNWHAGPPRERSRAMPRVTPIAGKADVAPEHQAVVDDVLKVFGAVRGPFSMMLHSPEMTRRLLPLVPFFRDESIVEGRLRSVGILAAVREREAAYVWAAQVAAARRN